MSQWLFTLNEDFVWQSPFIPKHAAKFSDELGRTWLTIEEDRFITIHKGYAWNGCSPTIQLFDWGYIGTPNGSIDLINGVSKTHNASLIHDALYQFMDKPAMPYSRKQMDRLFLALLKEEKFSLRYVYYAGLRLFGGLYTRTKKLLNR